MIKFIGKEINTGNTIEGVGVAKCTEEAISGREIMILFTNLVEWVDGSEFHSCSFEFVWADTVQIA